MVGLINPDVQRNFLSGQPVFTRLLQPFLEYFDITYGGTRSLQRTQVSYVYLKPGPQISSELYLDREVVLVYSDYNQIEPRTFEVSNYILKNPSIPGRFEPHFYLLLTPATNAIQVVRRALTENAQSTIPIPFLRSECQTNSNSGFIIERLREYLSERDYFDIRDPITDDQYYFGRTTFLTQTLGSLKAGNNVGLFGLRKMGKTSLLFKLKRMFENAEEGSVLYFNMEDPQYSSMRWWELVSAIRNNLPSVDRNIMLTETNAATFFDITIEMLSKKLPDQRIIITLDEIENISPGTSAKAHWAEDSLEFFRLLRSIQTKHRNLSVIICGLNATVAERSSFQGKDNPLFNWIQVRYMPAFDVADVKNMIETLGKYMGVGFEPECFTLLSNWYGGHPLLTRMACSWLYRSHKDDSSRKVVISANSIVESQHKRDRSMFAYGQHVLDVLRRWYPNEYTALQLLCTGDEAGFKSVTRSRPDILEHLESYGLLDNTGLRIRIPFLSSFVYEDANLSEPDASDRIDADIKIWRELNADRNRLEVKLRNFIRTLLAIRLGPEKWYSKITQSLTKERREQLEGYDRTDVLNKRLFFAELLQIVSRNWDIFCVLEKAGPLLKVNKREFEMLTDHINAQRADAHAREISEAELAAVKHSIEIIERAIDAMG